MEAPPLKNLIFAITFFSSFALLVAFMPSEFLEGDPQYRYASTPDYFEAIDVQDFAQTFTQNITSSPYQDYWGLDEGFGHNFYFHAVWYPATSEGLMQNRHYFLFWGIGHGHHQMNWIGSDGYDYGGVLTDAEAENNYEDGASEFTLQCSHVNMHTWVVYDTTSYSSIAEAWEANDLSVVFAIDFEELGTGMNAWNLIGALLFFQLPDVHPTINAFIAIPLWCLIGYCIFAFILAVIKSLPFT